ncbi:MAG: VOC family protein [Spirochaetales bacterium]|nr:VOC family protein [Spirochaetales bacterium]
MEQRISFITLGVQNLQRARDFYVDVLGWKPMKDDQGVVFFLCQGIVLGLFPSQELALDMGQDFRACHFRPFSLACNLRSEAEVDAFFQDLKSKNVRILKEPQRVFWGGYHGYFADSEGNAWEVAYNPFVKMDDEGRLLLHE